MNRAPAARVSAVIVHYRTPEETLEAARAVADSAPEAEIVIVDNASGDRIGARLASDLPAARLLVETHNRGYGAACNRGARESGRPYLLFLNSDAIVRPGAVETLVAALEADSRAAAAGPRLENSDGTLQPSIQKLPTVWRVFCESSGLAFLAGGRPPFRGHTATREDHGRPQSVEAVKGAALLVRRTAFEEVGGFDERFFLYGEETDLMARWPRAGWKVLYEPGAAVIHSGGASGGDALFGQVHEGLVRHVRKHQGPAAALVARVALTAGAAGRYLVSLATPGERGRARRLRYRAALSHPPRRA